MLVGILKEIKAEENRVCMTPAGVEVMIANGHAVVVEKDAGCGSGFDDAMYISAGAEMVDTPKEIFDRADMVMHVKEPLASEYEMIRLWIEFPICDCHIDDSFRNASKVPLYFGTISKSLKTKGETQISSLTDILFDSPKTNKTIPLLVRQIPFYIMIYPTNRSEYNIFNDKSRIVEIGKDGSISRELRCKTHINPEFTVNRTNKFIKYKTDGRDAVDVLGIPDTQTRISFIDADDEIFKTGFKKGNTFVPPSEYDVDREKTGFRVIREIINELDTNYELSINGVGKTLTEFDAFSRLTLKQFNVLSRLENFDEINKAVSNGFVNDVKLIPPIENADTRIVINKTQLVQRKSTAGTDTFKPIKSTNDGRGIISPDEKGVGGFGPST